MSTPRLAVALLALLLLPGSRARGAEPRYVTVDDALPVVEAMRTALPPGLAGMTGPKLAAAWPGWVRERDRAVRERLHRGEQDTVVNLLFFGTSYTSAPRLTAEGQARLGKAGTEAALARRVEDLSGALARPGTDERLALARAALGIAAAGPDRQEIARAVVEVARRVRGEQAAFAEDLARIRALPDATEQMAARSTLFRDRGIALDTSLRPAFAVEEALRDALGRGLLARGGVRRVAVVGPGLDFVDKAEGQDFYPPQSLQCLALADSLLRLGLSRPDSLSVTALDISGRVLDHLSRARQRALQGEGYVLQLPRPREGWGPALEAYWQRAGDQVGGTGEAVKPPPSAGEVVVRAVRVRPELVARVFPLDLNAVYQRLDLPEGERFDLVVATNVLVYYDTFEQALALSNVAAMTAPGGLFLSNNAVLELPGSRLRSVGYRTVEYSDRPADGEHVIFYRLTAGAGPGRGRRPPP